MHLNLLFLSLHQMSREKIVDDIAIQMAQYIEPEKYVLLYSDSFKHMREDEKVQFFFETANVLFSKAYYRHSISLWKYCLDYCTRINDVDNAVLCYTNLGAAHNMINEQEKSISYLLKASEAYKSNNNKIGQAKVYNNLSSVYLSVGQYNKAIEYGNRALNILEQMPDTESKKSSQSVSYSNLGLCFHFLGNYHEALKYHYRSLKIDLDSAKDDGIAFSYVNLGVEYNSVGEFKKALDYFDKALNLIEKNGNDELELKCHANKANVFFIYGDYNKVIELNSRALPITTKIGNKEAEASCYVNIGNAFRIVGSYMTALSNFKKALPITTKIGNKEAEAACYVNIGITLRELNDFE